MAVRRRPRLPKTPGMIAAAVLGGIVLLALAVGAVIGLGYLFFLLAKLIIVSVARAIVDGIKHSTAH